MPEEGLTFLWTLIRSIDGICCQLQTLDEIWLFDDKSLAIQTTVFLTWFIEPGSKYRGLIGAKSVFNSLYLGH